MIDDIEPLIARRIVGAADIDEADEPAARIVAQESGDGHNGVSFNRQREFPEGNFLEQDRRAKGASDMLAKVHKRIDLDCIIHSG
jgi:hypothetical protein